MSQERDEDAKLGIADRGITDLQPSDDSISEKKRSALVKRVALEKRRTSSNKKVDLRLVSDPKGMSASFPCRPISHDTRSIMWLILSLLL